MINKQIAIQNLNQHPRNTDSESLFYFKDITKQNPLYKYAEQLKYYALPPSAIGSCGADGTAERENV